MDKKKEYASVPMMATIIKELCRAPENQLTPEIKETCMHANKIIHTLTPQNMFDFIVDIHKKPNGEISSFVRTLTNLERYYYRPKEPRKKINIKRILWRALICVYAPLLYFFDVAENVFDEKTYADGDGYNLRRTKVTFLMYWYRY